MLFETRIPKCCIVNTLRHSFHIRNDGVVSLCVSITTAEKTLRSTTIPIPAIFAEECKLVSVLLMNWK